MDHEPTTDILSEYNQLVESLQLQIETYKTEHDYLRSEILKVLRENNGLVKLVDDEFTKKLQEEVIVHVPPLVSSEMAQNLRRQLELSLTERRQLLDVVAECRQQIRILAGNHFQKSTHGTQKAITFYDSKVEDLSMELRMEKSIREDQESAKLKFQTELARIQVKSANQKEQIEDMEKKMREMERKISSVEQENIVLRATIECVTQSRDSLESALSDVERRLEASRCETNEAKMKVEEAVDVAEKAVLERDVVSEREKLLHEQIAKLEQNGEEMLRNFNKGNEIERMKLNEEIEKVKTQLSVKNEELGLVRTNAGEIRKEYELLKKETENYDKDIQVYEKLVEDYAELEKELDIKRKLLNDTKYALKDVLNENDQLLKQLGAMASEQTQSKTQIIQLSDKMAKCKCSWWKDKWKNMKMNKNKQIADLERQLEKQLTLNEKWMKESEKLVSLLDNKSGEIARQKEKIKGCRKKIGIKKLWDETIASDKLKLP